MLVLTRKSGQELVINGQIRVRVLSSRAGSVRLGIEAPKEVAILRGEVNHTGQTLPHDQPDGQITRLCQIPSDALITCDLLSDRVRLGSR